MMEWLWLFPILTFIYGLYYWTGRPGKAPKPELINLVASKIIWEKAAKDLKYKQAHNRYEQSKWESEFANIEAMNAITAVGYPLPGRLVPPNIMDFIRKHNEPLWEVFKDHNDMIEIEQRTRWNA